MRKLRMKCKRAVRGRPEGPAKSPEPSLWPPGLKHCFSCFGLIFLVTYWPPLCQSLHRGHKAVLSWPLTRNNHTHKLPSWDHTTPLKESFGVSPNPMSIRVLPPGVLHSHQCFWGWVQDEGFCWQIDVGLNPGST